MKAPSRQFLDCFLRDTGRRLGSGTSREATMRRVILLAAFLAACGEGREQTGPVVSLRPDVTGTWRAELSGDGFLTGDTAFVATMSAIAEFRFTQSGDTVTGEYAVEGTISTLDPDGATFSFPLIATGLVDGEISTMADPGDPPMPMVMSWRLTATLASFSGGADASLTAHTGDLSPTRLPVNITFEVSGLVHEGRTYQLYVRGTAVKVS